MCGIIGVFGRENSKQLVAEGLAVLKNRGRDSKKIISKVDYSIGHCLHAVVNSVKQPLAGKGILTSNCEIYNWQELDKKHALKAKNDSEALFKLLEKSNDIKRVIDELDGVFAFAYLTGDNLFLVRDIIGVKPLWYSSSDGFAFASEKKALEKIGYLDINELNPRKIIKYNIRTKKITFIQRKFFDIKPEVKTKIKERLQILLEEAVDKRIPKRKFGLLFSGGIDSTMLALMLKDAGCKFKCYTAVLDDPNLKAPEDLVFAEKAAEMMGLNLKVIKIKTKDIEKYLNKIVPLIEDSNVVKVGVALTFYAACEQAKKDGCKVIFSGLGSEEIFAGYQRHKESHDINKECVSGLLKMYERDLYRDDVITMFNSLELRVPFLDKTLVDFSLKIPSRYKISKDQGKVILRQVGARMGLNKEFVTRKKRAAQYGSNFHKAIKKLAKKAGYRYISEYLREFYPGHNVRLGALISSGKDSVYAMFKMLKQNYPVDCLVSVKSHNKDSFMFHTPGIEMVELQARSMGIPLIEQETAGEKEAELSDLKKALEKAKKRYKIQGVVTGALYSNYQRERIEKICDSLSLKIFSPLWHIDQETEMREILDSGFRFILTKIAAEGLDKTWLGREITHKDIDKLVELNDRIGLNIAGEGGEFESLMTDGPIFDKKIVIKSKKIVEEDRNTAELFINKAILADK